MSDKPDGCTGLYAELPVEIVDQIREDDRPNKEVLLEAIQAEYGLNDASGEHMSRQHAERHGSAVCDLADEIAELEAAYAEHMDKCQKFARRQRKAIREKESYATRANSVLDELEEFPNKRISAFSQQIRGMATDEYGSPNPDNRDEVVNDLRERAVEQDRDISEKQWRDGTGGDVSPAVAAADGGEDTPAWAQEYADGGED
jgi:hypothetical protein